MPNTCNRADEEQNELAAVVLYPDCQRQPTENDSEPSLYCEASREVESWSLSDEYMKCVNTPQFAGSGVKAHAIEQRLTNCS